MIQFSILSTGNGASFDKAQIFIIFTEAQSLYE